MNQSPCPICRHGTPAKLDGESWSDNGQTYHLLHCETCQTCFTAPRPDDAFLGRFYRESFNYTWYADHLQAKLRDAELRYGEYQPWLQGSVLDFGGGLGYFSQTCRARGHHSITFDPYTSNMALTEKWDCLVALHVLEHSNNPDELLENMKGLLQPGGRLILAVPNYAGLGYRRQGTGWVWAQPPFMHIFHFSAISLCVLLERHGFSNIEISYCDRWDANIWCDIEHEKSFRWFDAARGRQPFKSVPLLRKSLARFNSYRRFHGLQKSLQNKQHARDLLSELQVTAISPMAPR